MAKWSSCEQYEDGQRVNGGREQRDICLRKKRKDTQRAGYLYCGWVFVENVQRVENK